MKNKNKNKKNIIQQQTKREMKKLITEAKTLSNTMKDYFSNTQTKEPDKPPNIQHHNNLQTEQKKKESQQQSTKQGK